ncbi:MAG: hypothetical protein LBE50_06450 [Gallionellaceae bacterium]|jgi:hypothetical protein|nr:hypothetical protein [Gallionellaceae bacterium]
MSYSNWSVLTASFVITTYLALSGVTLCAVLYLVGARWRLQVYKLATSLYALFPLAFVLLLILLVGGEHTFPWLTHGEGHGEHELFNSGWEHWYTLPALATRQIIGMLAVMFVWRLFIQRQEVRERSDEDALKFHRVACWVPFFTVLYATMVAWDFEMTLSPHWHSAIYGMQNLVSNFGMFLAFMLIWVYVLNTRNKLTKQVDYYIYNYFAQMMLAFTLLWMYTFFAQYLTIWYGNIGAERDRIDGMQNGDYSVLWWTMVAMKFVIPFASLCFPATRHVPQATVAVAVVMIIGTLIERFIWVAGVHDGKGDIPVVMMLAVGAVVFGIGYMLVRQTMRGKQLLKG